MRALATRVDWLEADDGTSEPEVTDDLSGTPTRAPAGGRPGSAPRIPAPGRRNGPPLATGASGRTSPAGGPAKPGPARAGSRSASSAAP